MLCGAYGLFGGSEELIGARILLPALNEIYRATSGLPSDVNWPLRSCEIAVMALRQHHLD